MKMGSTSDGGTKRAPGNLKPSPLSSGSAVPRKLPSIREHSRRVSLTRNTFLTTSGSPQHDEHGRLHPRHPAKPLTINFVYSQAVERAFRKTFNTSAFSKRSAHDGRGRQPMVEIPKLPDLYSDFLFMKDVANHNKVYIDKLRQEVKERRQRERERELELERELKTQGTSRRWSNAHLKSQALGKFSAGTRGKLRLPLVTPGDVPDRRRGSLGLRMMESGDSSHGRRGSLGLRMMELGGMSRATSRGNTREGNTSVASGSLLNGKSSRRY